MNVMIESGIVKCNVHQTCSFFNYKPSLLLFYIKPHVMKVQFFLSNFFSLLIMLIFYKKVDVNDIFIENIFLNTGIEFFKIKIK